MCLQKRPGIPSNHAVYLADVDSTWGLSRRLYSYMTYIGLEKMREEEKSY